jgi:hypothetical protein
MFKCLPLTSVAIDDHSSSIYPDAHPNAQHYPAPSRKRLQKKKKDKTLTNSKRKSSETF